MVDEPRQVLVHEFFHVMAQAVLKYANWARRAWLEASLHPELSPSGYALANPDEFWAEAMAARELGFEFGLLGPLEEFLRDSLPGYSAEDAEWSESDHPRAENGLSNFELSKSYRSNVHSGAVSGQEFQAPNRMLLLQRVSLKPEDGGLFIGNVNEGPSGLIGAEQNPNLKKGNDCENGSEKFKSERVVSEPFFRTSLFAYGAGALVGLVLCGTLAWVYR